MSPRPATARALPVVRTAAVGLTVAALVAGAAVGGRWLLGGADAGAPEGDTAAPPTLTLSTYLGGLEWDEATDVEVDDAGNRYVSGFTLSRDFPGAVPVGPGGIVDAVVSKVSADGALVWSVVLGGSDLDVANGLALDPAGNAYVTGRTGSPDFPTEGALQPDLNGSECTGAPCHDAFVTKLDPDGGVVYSTYLGGSLNEEGLSIAVDDAGGAVVAGNTDSRDLPTVAPFQADFGSLPCAGDVPCGLDVFVSRLTPDGSELAASTYLGGNAGDTASGVALADDGTAFVTGTTRSTDFPTADALQGSLAGTACGPPPGGPCPDAFVTALSPDGSSARYSTLLGGAEPEAAGGIAVDGEGRAVVTGSTQSTDFPTARPAQAALAEQTCTAEAPEELCDDAFVTRLSPDGTALDFSTYLGGEAEDQGLGVAVSDSGTVVVAGRTDSRGFPVRTPVQEALGGYIDGFATAFSAADGSLAWSTFLGGSDADRANAVTVDAGGVPHVVGRTLSPDFPTVAPLQAELQDEDYDEFLSSLG
jgi:hypothetical protein